MHDVVSRARVSSKIKGQASVQQAIKATAVAQSKVAKVKGQASVQQTIKATAKIQPKIIGKVKANLKVRPKKGIS